jgi:hypothetical protein
VTDMPPNLWTDGRFFEYQNTGPGAGVNANRPQLSDGQATEYTPQEAPCRHGRLEPRRLTSDGGPPRAGGRRGAVAAVARHTKYGMPHACSANATVPRRFGRRRR